MVSAQPQPFLDSSGNFETPAIQIRGWVSIRTRRLFFLDSQEFCQLLSMDLTIR